jgi:hypothetical protein
MKPCFSRKGAGKRLGQQVDAPQSGRYAGPTQTAPPAHPGVPAPAEGNDGCNHGRRIASPRAAILIVDPRQHAFRLALIDAALDEGHKLIAQIRGAHACTDVHMGAAHAHLSQDIQLTQQLILLQLTVPCPEGRSAVFAGRVAKKLIRQTGHLILGVQHLLFTSSLGFLTTS